MAIIKESDADNKHKIKPFLTEIISQACGNPEKNYLLKINYEENDILRDFNVNKGCSWKRD